MGMAASQARLLSLTARLHDVEFEAQSIQQAKLALADQEDAVYQRYLDALDASVITGQMMVGTEKATIPATFKNLCGGWENMLATGEGRIAYGIVNQKSGNLYVTQEVYDAYNKYSGKDPEEFALQMLGFSEAEIEAYIKHRDTKGTFYPLSDTESATNALKLKKVDPSTDEYTEANKYYTLNAETGGYEEVEDMALYTSKDETSKTIFNEEALSSVTLYTEIGEEDTSTTAEAVVIDVSAIQEKLTSSEGEYYKNTFAMISECGGCEVIPEDCVNNSEWLTTMVEQGEIGIYVLTEEETEEDGYHFEQISTSSDVMLTDTSVSSLDSTELKKAEAEYNKDLKAINRKDTQYDTALEELETERSAITTEIDSIRTVIDENVERTFGVFS